eukprot:CAMPEP_0182418822 /NCGR_PEP_ID=MMETSP1167-20130531/3198_1 /TAXON_ID=2988 /ORGANISM="Mallomonas Sp, Strain CCMP3275" /LENGTH=350 /DNA_ID=CAMNT_0024593241 /DNA_START=195 /DNA_END=1246 /DNA_ORIENTATION=-
MAPPRFTGWSNVPLTDTGAADAIDAGHLMGERGLKFDVAFTSSLERAYSTCSYALSASNQPKVEQIRSWRLNERHYGMLQGHRKNCERLLEAFGEEQIIEWRRSYHTAPPSPEDFENMNEIQKNALSEYDSLQAQQFATYAFSFLVKDDRTGRKTKVYPGTESLKQCEERAFGYWKEVIAPRVKKGDRVLIVAHANTIRALVKAVDNIADDMIPHLKIPNGVPLVYTMDDNLNPIQTEPHDIGFHANYLVSPRNHEKTMEYERCVRKKLRSLFEYLDTDRDGRITSHCLHSGLHRLQLFREVSDPVCEYAMEEILRSVPDPDDLGGVTLDAFLQAEQTLLPKLSKLRMLQ